MTTQEDKHAEIDRILAIIDRVWPTMQQAGWRDRAGVSLALLICHRVTCPLRLQEMLDGQLSDTIHDVAGIHRHFNLRTRRLENAFMPRYANTVWP